MIIVEILGLVIIGFLIDWIKDVYEQKREGNTVLKIMNVFFAVYIVLLMFWIKSTFFQSNINAIFTYFLSSIISLICIILIVLIRGIIVAKIFKNK
jgi:hypothetical protein